MFKVLSGNLSATFNLDGNHLDRYLQRKQSILKSICEELILHEQILIPTHDYLTACGLILILGERNFISLLESNKVRFLRLRGLFGYVRGKGPDGGLVAFGDPDNNRPQDSDIELSVQAGLSVISDVIKEKETLTKFLVSQSTPLEIIDILNSVQNDSYEDLKKTSLWRKKYAFPKKGLLRLPKIEKMQVRVLGPNTNIKKNPIDMLLALTLFNAELYLSILNECVSHSTASPIGDSIELKIARLTNHNLAIENLWSLCEINSIPSFEKINVLQNQHFDDLLKLTESSKANIFRQWFHEKKFHSEKEIFREYVGILKDVPWIQRLPSKIIRFVITTSLDLIPIVGKVASVLDEFVVEKIITGKSPKYFIDDLKTFTGNIHTEKQ